MIKNQNIKNKKIVPLEEEVEEEVEEEEEGDMED